MNQCFVFHRIDSELDLIGTQQQELEAILTQLETNLELQPHVTDSQHADAERRRM